MEAAFMSDALDDLRDALAPKPSPATPSPMPLYWLQVCAKFRYYKGVRDADRGFLVAVDEASWALGLTEWSLAGEQAQLWSGRVPAYMPSHKPVEGARGKIKQSLYQVGVFG